MSDDLKVRTTISCGKTEYRMEDDTPGFVKITRINSDGTRELWIPTGLIVQYAAERIRRTRAAKIVQEVRENLGF